MASSSKVPKIIFSISENPSIRGMNYYENLFLQKKKKLKYFPLKINSYEQFRKYTNFLTNSFEPFYGMSISMPYKENICNFIDIKHPSVQKSLNANTIIKKNGKIYGFNTDYMAIQKYKFLKKTNSILIIGSGGLAKSFASYFKLSCNTSIYCRSKKKFEIIKKINKKIIRVNNLRNFSYNHSTLIICTPQECLPSIVKKLNFNFISHIIDCSNWNKNTLINKKAQKHRIKYFNAFDFYKKHLSYQRKIYLNGKI